MLPGDIAGISAFQRDWAMIGLSRQESGYALEVHVRTAQDSPCGRLIQIVPWHRDSVRLKVIMDFTEMRDSASLWAENDSGWICLHSDHPMSFSLEHFTGNKVGLFHMSRGECGGSACFSDFVLDPPEESAELS